MVVAAVVLLRHVVEVSVSMNEAIHAPYTYMLLLLLVHCCYRITNVFESLVHPCHLIIITNYILKNTLDRGRKEFGGRRGRGRGKYGSNTTTK